MLEGRGVLLLRSSSKVFAEGGVPPSAAAAQRTNRTYDSRTLKTDAAVTCPKEARGVPCSSRPSEIEIERGGTPPQLHH